MHPLIPAAVLLPSPPPSSCPSNPPCAAGLPMRRQAARAPGSPADSPASAQTPRSLAAAGRRSGGFYRLGPRSWLMSAVLLAAALAGVQLLSGFQHAEASTDIISHWISRKLSVQEATGGGATVARLNHAALISSHRCTEAVQGQPEQRVCTFENIVLFNGRVIYISDGEHGGPGGRGSSGSHTAGELWRTDASNLCTLYCRARHGTAAHQDQLAKEV